MSMDQTHWVPVQRAGPLPTFYYHEHFVELLAFVETHYAHVLEPGHARLIDAFRALPREAQCLYVRLVNRKGRVFAVNRLRYPELGPVDELVPVLREHGFVAAPGPEHVDDLLRFLTRAELLQVLSASVTGVARSLKKAELILLAREHVEPEVFVRHVATQRLCVQQHVEALRYLMFLYFGRIHASLSQFTMRDLGLVRTQSADRDYEPRFQDRDAALEQFYFANARHNLRNGIEPQRLLHELGDWPDANFTGSARERDKLAFELGRALEKAGDTDAAALVYARGESARCSERELRLLLARDREAGRRLLEARLDAPRSTEEFLLASDLYERKFEKKRTSALTDTLRAGETLHLDESMLGAPERAAADHFSARGHPAFRVENLFWRSLFGLLFWEELFGGNEGGLHSPFEILPAPLADGSFHGRFAEAITARLDSLQDRATTKRHLLRVATREYGTPNGVFRWRQPVLDAVYAFIDVADPDAMRRILQSFAQDYRSNRHGWPDLLVIDDDGPRFVEIKAEGDQLRRNQLLRLRQLADAGFRADVVQVRWVLDPAQVYVVVDVETTGGRGDAHRVTEIGAVKVQNGRIIDRFQTLLNPQRRIPPNISRLTGITPAMVADAPYFADIADDFATFMGEAIFCAHNVEFDYGFISREFQRLGRSFRHAKLCTCASMRKLYPGHRSYSLAALCRAFDIPLRSHHRALCDAEAAAELLLLVNEKRAELLAASAGTEDA